MPQEIIEGTNSVTIQTIPTSPEAPKPEEKLIAGKFKTSEDLEKAYLELEKKLGAPKQEETTPNTAKHEETQQHEVKEALRVAGLDMSDFTKEYAEKGELSEASFKQLEEKGFPKKLVEQYINGQKAQTELQTVKAEHDAREIKAVVGSDEDYQRMLQWASLNASPQDVDDFNRRVLSGDKSSALEAVKKMNDKYLDAVGREPKRFVSGSESSDSGDVFRSFAQVTEAMRDPRYKTDSAYNAAVIQKLQRSKL